MKVVAKIAATGGEQKRCVPEWLTWNWHHNRRPKARS